MDVWQILCIALKLPSEELLKKKMHAILALMIQLYSRIQLRLG